MSRPFPFLHFLWNRRSLCATVFFVLVVGFLDENSFMNLYNQKQENAALRADIKMYEDQYNQTSERLRLIETSPRAVEEMARVKLLMKSDDEDIYIVE